MRAGKNIQRWLLGVILAGLFLPLVQETIGLVDIQPLEGAYTPAVQPKYTAKNWFESGYQDSTERWYTEQFGFRNVFVKLHNELEFDLYKNTNVNGVFAGKDDYLYAIDYLRGYRGDNFVGEAEIRKLAFQMKMLQDSLEKQHSTFLFVLAPSKCYYFPEYLPEAYSREGAVTNYRRLTHYLDSLHVNTINFNSWFVQSKERLKYPLYPRAGVHWSRYGSALACDSIIRWVEWKRGIDMPNLVMKGMELSTTPRDPDNDMGKAMNLFFPIRSQQLAYPQYTFEDTTGKTRPSMLGIGDSYFWSLWDMGIGGKTFRSVDFWYYDQEASHSDGRPNTPLKDVDRYSETRKYEVVVLIATDPNLGQVGWGYLTRATTPAEHTSEQERELLILRKEEAIRADAAWLESVRKKAVANGITLEEQIRRDAVYMVDLEKGK